MRVDDIGDIIDAQELSMAQLIVRQLDDRIAEKLKELAAKAGISTEEAHRRILAQALLDESSSFKQALQSMPDVGEDSDFARGPQPERKIDW